MDERSAGDAARSRFRRARRLLVGLAAMAMALVVAPVPGTAPTALNLAARDTCEPSRPMQMVEANIKAGMTRAQTRADLAKVYADSPDFVAFNEVAGRPDSMLAPSGYEIWRTPGRYTGANPVVWRTDRWNVIARGTIYLTIVGGKTATQSTELGIRYANWATLRSVDGCQTLSIVAYHVAPKSSLTGDLLLPSVHKLGGLARSLAADGPVLLAGDLNRHVRSREYPRSLLSSYGLTATWDMTGTIIPTGDHRGATIDYVFVHTAAQFRVTRQITRELYSDHDAVVANLALDRRVVVPRPGTTFIRGHVVNVPESPLSAGRRAVSNRLLKAVQLAPAGSTMLMATARLDDPALRKSLVSAHRRGVNVRIVSWSSRASTQELALMEELGQARWRRSFVVRRAYSTEGALPPAAVLFTSSAGVRLLGIQADQPLDAHMIARTTRGQFTVERADWVRLRDRIRLQFQ
ncbi:MAG TPA: endonuclease/exonuclease/phosphatase family protein [Nocardioides sp.]|nr:endonuclease/exonuclease/phosphatase family protein [Nocardioides sp.]